MKILEEKLWEWAYQDKKVNITELRKEVWT